MKAMPFTPQKGGYSTKEAAAYLSVSEQTVRKLIVRGLLRKSHALAKVVIPGTDVETLLERTCSKPLES